LGLPNQAEAENVFQSSTRIKGIESMVVKMEEGMDRIQAAAYDRCHTAQIPETACLPIVGMAEADVCARELIVLIKWQGEPLAVPLGQFEPTARTAMPRQVPVDRNHWVDRANMFGASESISDLPFVTDLVSPDAPSTIFWSCAEFGAG